MIPRLFNTEQLFLKFLNISIVQLCWKNIFFLNIFIKKVVGLREWNFRYDEDKSTPTTWSKMTLRKTTKKGAELLVFETHFLMLEYHFQLRK